MSPPELMWQYLYQEKGMQPGHVHCKFVQLIIQSYILGAISPHLMRVLRLQTSHGTALWLMAIVFELAKHFVFLLLHCLDELVRVGGTGFSTSSPLLTILVS